MDWTVGPKSRTKFLFISVQTESKAHLASSPGGTGGFPPLGGWGGQPLNTYLDLLQR